MADTSYDLVERITQDMRQAMKQQQRTELAELRSLLARISNAEAVHADSSSADSLTTIAGAATGVGSTEVRRKVLSSKELTAILVAERQEIEAVLSRIDSDTHYAAELRSKIAAVQQYL